MTQAPVRDVVRRQVVPVYGAGFVTVFGAHAVAAAAALAVYAGGFLLALTGLPGLIAGAILIGTGVATATPAGFTRLAATTPAGQLGRTMGTAEAGRELGDAGGPVLVGAFGVVSLTTGLGALAAILLACAALAAPRPREPIPSSSRHHVKAGRRTPYPCSRGDWSR